MPEVVRSDFDYSILDAVAHRPWPMPDQPWVMTQSWHDLLFAHWPIDPSVIERQLPSGLAVDRFEGRAWIGVVPFHMTNVRLRGWPKLPGVSAFPELNVRTYVRPVAPAAGSAPKPGVWFFSLDAASRLAVMTARALFHLPYFGATMRVEERDGVIAYESTRRATSTSPDAARFKARYQPTGGAAPPHAGSLEHFLTERYCLHTTDRRGRLLTVEIHHPPWPLQPAGAEIAVNTMAAASGLPLSADPPILHFSRRQDVVVWAPSRYGRAR